MRFVKVAFPVPVRKTFTYRVPEALVGAPLLGRRVAAPFGRQGRKVGYVVEETDATPSGMDTAKLKSIEAVLDEKELFSAGMLDFTRWTAGHYVASWGEVLRCAHPVLLSGRTRKVYRIADKPMADSGAGTLACRLLAALRERPEGMAAGMLARAVGAKVTPAALAALVERGLVRVEDKAVHPRAEKTLLAVEAINAAPDVIASGLGPVEAKVLDFLLARGEAVGVAELLDVAKSAHAVVKNLKRKGLVKVFPQRVFRDPFWDLPAMEGKSATGEVVLTREQQQAFDALAPAVREGCFQAALLHGVTGSGKTEIYIRLIREALAQGRRALYLVPEIGLTPLASERLRARFRGKVAILHSGLSDGERHDEWDRVRRGEVDVVVGTRSAVFAPVENLGLVIVDEEHDTSYKQEEPPYYHGRDLAVVRAKRANAPVILGSATPSTESFHNARREGGKEKYLYIELKARVEKRPMPDVRLVDMTQEFRETGERRILSRDLEKSLGSCLKKKEQAMLLLNRRGYAPFLLCRECGWSPGCPECSVALTLHSRQRQNPQPSTINHQHSYLLCHYCGHRAGVPPRCPDCESGGSAPARNAERGTRNEERGAPSSALRAPRFKEGTFVQMVGWGTEQVEEHLKKRFPEARILRLDRDTASGKDAHHRILSAFARGEADILVGTQMIAKGHDFARVTLVGVISADTGLSTPDFRAAERAFQLLIQVSGRAGRAEKKGEVVVQTVNPKHYAVALAAAHDVEAFYEKELWFRRAMKYPPFSAMAVVLVRDEDDARAVALVRRVAEAIRRVRDPRVSVLGPAPAPLARLKGVYRYHVILKSASRGRIRDVLDKALSSLKRFKRESVRVNIDPVSVL